jgi:hypothetical protein
MDKKSPAADSPLVSYSPLVSDSPKDNIEIDNESIMKFLISMDDKTNRRFEMMNESIKKLATLFR